MGQRINERRKRLLQCHAHGQGRLDFHFFDAVELVGTGKLVFGIEHAIQCHLHRLGIEIGAIVKLHALT